MFDSMPETRSQGWVCGIDLGGTKIEAKLFDADLKPSVSKQIATPHSDYDTLLKSIKTVMDWARQRSGNAEIPIGFGLPGLLDRKTGIALTCNIPATGKTLAADVARIAGRPVAMDNDCKCFALSEANGGAADRQSVMFGLILGTGLGGGVCHDGMLSQGLNRVAGEVGHFSLPASMLQEQALPILPCSCGRVGCFETLLSGRGIRRLDRHFNACDRQASELIHASKKNDHGAIRVVDTWFALLGELLHTIQLMVDPDCIILGGGLTNIANIESRARKSMRNMALASLRLPNIRTAHFGTNSGSRGAALLALQHEMQKKDA